MKETTTWAQFKQKMLDAFTPEVLAKLKKIKIKRVEIGSIAWFSRRRKTKGKFLNLNTMFLVRLLKR